MDSITEHMGIQDLFNVVVCGVLFIGTLFFYYPEIVCSRIELKEYKEMVIVIIVVLSFLIGIVIQELGELIDEKIIHIRDGMLENYLKRSSHVLGNGEKSRKYRNYAKKILKEKELNYNKEFTDDQCVYVFGYCSYYIQVRGANKKIDKMRALYDMSRMLWVLGNVIMLMQIIDFLINMYTPIKGYKILLLFANIIIIKVLKLRMIKVMKYKIRMVMGVYEALHDKQDGKLNKNDCEKNIC